MRGYINNTPGVPLQRLKSVQDFRFSPGGVETIHKPGKSVEKQPETVEKRPVLCAKGVLNAMFARYPVAGSSSGGGRSQRRR